jgi:hypothetical protein
MAPSQDGVRPPHSKVTPVARAFQPAAFRTEGAIPFPALHRNRRLDSLRHQSGDKLRPFYSDDLMGAHQRCA